jgi:ribosomal protein S3
MYIFKYLNNFQLNIFKISKNLVKSNIISKYITTSLKNNYSIYETMRPILVDLKQYIIRKRIIGFKVAVSGRFKRAQRATY